MLTLLHRPELGPQPPHLHAAPLDVAPVYQPPAEHCAVQPSRHECVPSVMMKILSDPGEQAQAPSEQVVAPELAEQIVFDVCQDGFGALSPLTVQSEQPLHASNAAPVLPDSPITRVV